jgi:CRISPR-associated endonuclease Csn1
MKEPDIDLKNYDLNAVSKNTYRVQKLSSYFYTFRHHLASTIKNKNEELYIQSFKRWMELNPIKIRITLTGKIEKVP